MRVMACLAVLRQSAKISWLHERRGVATLLPRSAANETKLCLAQAETPEGWPVYRRPAIHSSFFGGAAAVTLNHSVSLLAAPPKNKTIEWRAVL